jgi:NAD(P)-dependent dehydrogenase (short-subunit alcohol dehydrogenase family)
VTVNPAGGTANFDFSDRVAVVTGGTGVLGRAIAHGFRRSAARVVILARNHALVNETAVGLGNTDEVMGVAADVLDADQLRSALDSIVGQWGDLHILVNAAGGNRSEATVAPDGSFFDVSPDAIRQVVDLNLMGTLLPIQIFGRAIADAGTGSIVNISSMAATRPLSRVLGYGAAKAAVENATRWLADHTARLIGPGVRVNAVAPGFFLSDQNRDLLVTAGGELTDRGRRIVDATPMGRLGDPDDVVGPVLWLASEASRFVTGAVIPVDGGFSATSVL